MSVAALRPVRKTTVVDGILERIQALLRESPGAVLPGERDLARRLGVSRPSVREALRTLERLGVLDVRHGSGTRAASSGADVLRTPLAFLLALDRPSIEELHETRTLLEVHLAGRAAERRTDDDLRAIAAALEAMRTRLRDPKAVTDPDVRFHCAIATASHNRLLERIMNGLQENIRELIDAAWPGNRSMKMSWNHHRAIYEAIRRGDPGGARRAMTVHMDLTTAELRSVGLIPRNKTFRRGTKIR